MATAAGMFPSGGISLPGAPGTSNGGIKNPDITLQYPTIPSIGITNPTIPGMSESSAFQGLSPQGMAMVQALMARFGNNLVTPGASFMPTMPTISSIGTPLQAAPVPSYNFTPLSSTMNMNKGIVVGTPNGAGSEYGAGQGFAMARTGMDAMLQQVLQQLMPSINKGAEASGASASTNQALLTSDAATKAAGQAGLEIGRAHV